MDISPVSALNPYALQTLGAAANRSSLLPAPDALAALAGSEAQASLAQGVAEMAAAQGLTSLPASEFTAVATALGGVSAATVSDLLPVDGSSEAGGFAPALNQNASLALEAYTSGIPEGNLSQVAAEEAAKASTPASAVQAALASSQANLLNLLG